MTNNEPAASSSSNNRNKPQSGTENLEITEKLRVLCFHGYRQNAAAFKSKLGSFRKFVSRYAEFVFIDAPHIAAPLSPGEEKNPEQRSWWANKDDGTFKGTNIGGPAFGFDESLRLVEQTWKSQGPFHGLLGFSQGACLVGLICGYAAKHLTSIKPEFAVIASGFPSGSLAHKSAYEELITTPCLHIYGLTDDIIPKEMSIELSIHFTNSEILQHDGGHYFPATAQQKATYIKFFQDRLQEHLENAELQNPDNVVLIEEESKEFNESSNESLD